MFGEYLFKFQPFARRRLPMTPQAEGSVMKQGPEVDVISHRFNFICQIRIDTFR